MNITLPLLRHGQRVRPEYEAPPGETEGVMGESSDEQRPDGQVSGIVKRFKKDEAAAYDPQALCWIKAVYPDAIEYTGMTKELQGMAFWCDLPLQTYQPDLRKTQTSKKIKPRPDV